MEKQNEIKVIREPGEEELQEIEEIKELRSLSRPEVAFTIIELRDDVYEVDSVWSRIRDRIDDAKLEFPPVLVEAEITQLIEEQARRWQMSGGKGMEDYLRIINKTEEEIREELRPVATKRVTQSLVLGKLAEDEKIEADSSEIDNEIKKMMAQSGDTENKEELQKFLETPQSRSSIERILITQKTVERLVEIARESKETTEKDKEEK